MTTTVLARSGTTLCLAVQYDGWCNYIGQGSYTPDQMEALAGALMGAQHDEFNSLLPSGCYWSPGCSEIVGPADTDLGEIGIDEAMEAACEAVIARFEAIEREALGVVQ